MKEILEKWGKFVKEQNEARVKVSDRMTLWHKENRYEGGYGILNTYDIYKLMRSMEENKLNKEFGVVDITVENFLTSLLSKD